jgi:hypothetical protein
VRTVSPPASQDANDGFFHALRVKVTTVPSRVTFVCYLNKTVALINSANMIKVQSYFLLLVLNLLFYQRVKKWDERGGGK